MIELENDCQRRLLKSKEKLTEMEDTLLQSYKDFSEEHNKRLALEKKLAEVKAQLETEREKNQALTARINKDYSNSSESSSMSPNHKTIHNSRKKSGLKPGGQPGHIHHGRKLQEPTERLEIPAPAEYVNSPKFKPTGKIIRKQLIKFRVETDVIEYWTQEFRNLETGQRVHAQFPDGIVDDVNYDGSVKALAYILKDYLYTSIGKTKDFLKEISQGKIDLSEGLISNLVEQFVDYTQKDRDLIFNKLITADVLHTDFTFGRAVGKQASVLISATDDGEVLYQGHERKGYKAIENSPVENYSGTLVSDHEASLIKHGMKHQECLAHVQRYAKGAAENETKKTWASKLDKWISDSITYWHEVHDNPELYDQKTANKYIAQLMDILKLARIEYRKEPAPQYYKEGYNLYKRMAKSPEDYVLFLREPSVPPTNNLAERYGCEFQECQRFAEIL